MANSITLPVSLGEALDKLTILDIKLEKINDDRIKDVQVEYDILKEKLTNQLQECSYYYRILKEINLSIWEMQDDFRDKKGDITVLCMKIIEENDRRFRVKKKINDLVNSSLKEQKGYARTKAFITTHLGNGDHLTCNGLVRYYSTIYDNITVCCYQKYLHNLQEFFADDKSITFYPVENHTVIVQNILKSNLKPSEFKKITKDYNDVIITGYRKDAVYDDVPFCFYNWLNLDHNIFWNYFHIPTLQKAIDMYDTVKNYNYIFIHNSSSTGELFDIKKILKNFSTINEETLILNPCNNFYEVTHKYHDIAEKICNQTISTYKLIIENAKINIVCDSSFFCFMVNLELKYDDNFLYTPPNYKWDYVSIFEKYPFDNTKINRKKFKKLENKI